MGKVNVVEMLLKYGADPNEMRDVYRGEGPTALHYAAMGGNMKVVEILLQLEVNVDQQDHMGMTPLHYAAMSGHEEVVEILLLCNADIYRKDERGWTAAEVAESKQKWKLADRLFEYQRSLEKRAGGLVE
jgi:hypothetical protein